MPHCRRRGLKTLALRVQRHNEHAGVLARFLASYPAVSKVNYPGLPEHPDHAIAAFQMRGFGGMLSFELHQPNQLDRLLSRLPIVMPALSLGGVESLIFAPSRSTHRRMTHAERQPPASATVCCGSLSASRMRKTCLQTSPKHWPWNDRRSWPPRENRAYEQH